MASPFASKLQTNYCPNDDEVSHIKALLIEPTLRLQRLDKEIAELQNTINKLIEERETLGAHVQAHAALISPARRLPLDIIQEIFVACLPTHRNCVMSAREAPVLLGRICSSWRTISLSTPRLWASLHIVDPGQRSESTDSTSSTLIRTSKDKSALILEVTETWLGRSGRCPLSISLHSSHMHEVPSAPTILQALITLACRWQRVRFSVPAPALESLVHLSGMDVPMLESIALYPSDPFVTPSFPWDDLGILRGPNLASVSVTGGNLDFTQLPLEWSQVTDLSNSDPSQYSPQAVFCEGALQTISRCPNLLRLSLCIIPGRSEIQTQTYSLVEHQILQTLHFAGTVSSFSPLLGRLSLPGLKDFTLLLHSQQLTESGHIIENGSADDAETLTRFLINSPLLDRLHLRTPRLSSSSLKEILRSLPPTLLHLHLDDGGSDWDRHASIDDDLLSSITPTPGVPTPCPALQDFRIDNNVISDVALLRFITARAPTLQRIHIDFQREMELDIHPNLAPFIESGLEATITYRSFLDMSPWAGLPDAHQSQR
ncbi:hypothetical protein B0H11DRAFT_2182090 [Mycena galericulata]|nr:hypothetical protein B0H11DRAFT_2182090 [Mycena galericulata]